MSGEVSGEEVKLTPMEKMRIRTAAEGYKSMDDPSNNNDKENLVPEKKEKTVDAKDDDKPFSALEQIMAVFLLITLVVIIVLSILLVMRGFDKTLDPVKCDTANCIEISGALIKNMNISAKPCDDFYQYACGRFEKDPLIPPDERKYSWFSFITKTVKAETKRLLDENGTIYQGKHSSAIAKAKLYYKVCMNTTALEKMGTAPLLKWLQNLGSWTLNFENITGIWLVNNINLEQSMASLVMHNIGSLFDISVGRDEKNTSINIIKFDEGSLSVSDNTKFTGNNSQSFQKTYTDYVVSIISVLHGNASQAQNIATELWTLESSLAKIMDKPENRIDINKLYNKMTVHQLQNRLDSTSYLFDLSAFLEYVFKEKVPPTEEVIVRSPNYFSKLGGILQTTSNETLAYFMIWKAIQKVIFYQPREVQSPALSLHSKILGISAHPLWYGCVASTEAILPDAVGALYVHQYFTKEKKRMATTLVREIVDTFKARLPKTDWMDARTMKNALEKVKAISYKIGYPDYIKNSTELDQTYELLTISNSTPFENYLSALTFKANNSFSERGKPPNPQEMIGLFGFTDTKIFVVRETNIPYLEYYQGKIKKNFQRWDMAPTKVNAYYSTVLNQMVFPAGVMNKPFFDLSYPMAMNYGSLGFIMGHELTHGFDNKGRNFGKHGNLYNWWSNSSSIHFNEKAKCLTDQYNKYKVGNKHINGLTTLGENIADNGGLKTSYKAYQSWLKSHGNKEDNAILPGLNTTERQLFFLSFAQSWCAYYTPQYAEQSIVTDPHTYSKYRIIGTLSNIPEFAVAYDCPVGSPMNPTKKCSVW